MHGTGVKKPIILLKNIGYVSVNEDVKWVTGSPAIFM
jgi:hypothetical protein